MIYKFHKLQGKKNVNKTLHSGHNRHGKSCSKGKWSQEGERERAAAAVPRTHKVLPSAAPAACGDPRQNPG